ncbi:MAG: DUF6252 family protein [Saprospiraceae bacterium]
MNRLIILLLLAGFLACDKDNNPITGCEMTAKIDGKSFCGDGFYIYDGSSVMTLQAINEDTDEMIFFTIVGAGEGTFVLGTGISVAGYDNPEDGESFILTDGSLIIEKFGGGKVEGTFSFNAEEMNTGATVSVTDGEFDVDNL